MFETEYKAAAILDEMLMRSELETSENEEISNNIKNKEKLLDFADKVNLASAKILPFGDKDHCIAMAMGKEGGIVKTNLYGPDKDIDEYIEKHTKTENEINRIIGMMQYAVSYGEPSGSEEVKDNIKSFARDYVKHMDKLPKISIDNAKIIAGFAYSSAFANKNITDVPTVGDMKDCALGLDYLNRACDHEFSASITRCLEHMDSLTNYGFRNTLSAAYGWDISEESTNIVRQMMTIIEGNKNHYYPDLSSVVRIANVLSESSLPEADKERAAEICAKDIADNPPYLYDEIFADSEYDDLFFAVNREKKVKHDFLTMRSLIEHPIESDRALDMLDRLYKESRYTADELSKKPVNRNECVNMENPFGFSSIEEQKRLYVTARLMYEKEYYKELIKNPDNRELINKIRIYEYLDTKSVGDKEAVALREKAKAVCELRGVSMENAIKDLHDKIGHEAYYCVRPEWTCTPVGHDEEAVNFVEQTFNSDDNNDGKYNISHAQAEWVDSKSVEELTDIIKAGKLNESMIEAHIPLDYDIRMTMDNKSPQSLANLLSDGVPIKYVHGFKDPYWFEMPEDVKECYFENMSVKRELTEAEENCLSDMLHRSENLTHSMVQNVIKMYDNNIVCFSDVDRAFKKNHSLYGKAGIMKKMTERYLDPKNDERFSGIGEKRNTHSWYSDSLTVEEVLTHSGIAPHELTDPDDRYENARKELGLPSLDERVRDIRNDGVKAAVEEFLSKERDKDDFER